MQFVSAQKDDGNINRQILWNEDDIENCKSYCITYEDKDQKLSFTISMNVNFSEYDVSKYLSSGKGKVNSYIQRNGHDNEKYVVFKHCLDNVCVALKCQGYAFIIVYREDCSDDYVIANVKNKYVKMPIYDCYQAYEDNCIDLAMNEEGYTDACLPYVCATELHMSETTYESSMTNLKYLPKSFFKDGVLYERFVLPYDAALFVSSNKPLCHIRFCKR